MNNIKKENEYKRLKQYREKRVAEGWKYFNLLAPPSLYEELHKTLIAWRKKRDEVIANTFLTKGE
jgi:hypothetical protein